MGLFSWFTGSSGKQEVAGRQKRNTPRIHSEAASFISWGEEMPQEENQYNSGIGHIEYFAKIFREDFPEYEAQHICLKGRHAEIFTLWGNTKQKPALIVELLSETSKAKKFRADCAAQKVPYLRFYYNHRGWWNTRRYIADRVRNALRG